MTTNVTLSEDRIHLWLARMLRERLAAHGYNSTDTGRFLKRTERLGLRQLHRMISMEAFLRENEGPLREAALQHVREGADAIDGTAVANAGGENAPKNGDLFFTTDDVGRFFSTALILMTGDDPGLVMDTVGTFGDVWEAIGRRFGEEAVRRISRYPPDGFTCRKFRNGFIAECQFIANQKKEGGSGGRIEAAGRAATGGDTDSTLSSALRSTGTQRFAHHSLPDTPCSTGPLHHAQHACAAQQPMPLAERFLSFAVPVLEQRFQHLRNENVELEKQVADLKKGNKKLHREIRDLKIRNRKDGRATIKQERELKQTRKRLKQKKGAGYAAPNEGGDDFMFG